MLAPTAYVIAVIGVLDTPLEDNSGRSPGIFRIYQYTASLRDMAARQEIMGLSLNIWTPCPQFIKGLLVTLPLSPFFRGRRQGRQPLNPAMPRRVVVAAKHSFSYPGARPCRRPSPKILQPAGVFTFLGVRGGKKEGKI